MYAVGDMENSLTNGFFPMLRKILIVAMHVNPLLIGLIEAVTKLWDAICGPLVAHLSDSTKSRWGRRRPYILFGGIARVLLLLLVVAWLPMTESISLNRTMEAQRHAKEGHQQATELHILALRRWDAMLEGGGNVPRPAFWKETGRLAEEIETTLLAQLPVLREDVEKRESARGTEDEEEPRVETARRALQLAEEGLARALAVRELADQATGPHASGKERAAWLDEIGRLAQSRFERAEIEGVEVFGFPQPKAVALNEPQEMKFWAPLVLGVQAFFSPEAEGMRNVVIYVLLATLVFSTVRRFHDVPYYALGLEICPSYHGRTRVVTYRKAVGKIGALLTPWMLVFCFSLHFKHALEGLWWVAVLSCVIGIPSTLVMFFGTRERRSITVQKQRIKLFDSIWELAKNPHILRLLSIHLTLSLANGVFSGFEFFLNTYWVMGSALAAAKLGVGFAMLAWVLGFLSLPVIQWACGRFQKHRVYQVAVALMATGLALRWWCFDPDHPEYQFVLPFFFSIGIGSVYTVLLTMLSDVADDDELRHGVRREAMLGAVMSSMMQVLSVIVPVLSGAVVLLSGYDPALEYEQTAETIARMRFLNSFAPAICLSVPLLLATRYPLTKERVRKNREELLQRRESRAAAG